MIKWLQRLMFSNPEREVATDTLRATLDATETEAAKVEESLDKIIKSEDPFATLIHGMRKAQFRRQIKREGGLC